VLPARLTAGPMVSGRAVPSLEALSEGASQKEPALATPRAIVSRAVLDREGLTVSGRSDPGLEALSEGASQKGTGAGQAKGHRPPRRAGSGGRRR